MYMVWTFYFFRLLFHVLFVCCALPFSFSCLPAYLVYNKGFYRTATKFFARKRCHLYTPSPQIPSLFYFLEAFLCSIRRTPFKIRKLSQILFSPLVSFKLEETRRLMICLVLLPSQAFIIIH